MITTTNYDLDANMSEIKEITEGIIEQFMRFLLTGEIDAIDIAKAIIRTPAAVNDYIFLRKINRFWNAITKDGTNKVDLVRFSSKLFDDDEENNKKAAYRLIQEINRIETDETIQFVVNASRALGNELIDKTCYFRIVWALSNSLTEDLLYFTSIATRNDMISGNIHVFSLAQNGIMLQAEVDSNKEVEEQSYIVTAFGKVLDRYSLSYENEEREKYWKKVGMDSYSIKYKTDAPRFVYDDSNEIATVKISD